MDLVKTLIIDADAIFVRTAVQFLETQEGIEVVGTIEDETALLECVASLAPQAIVLGPTAYGLFPPQKLAHLRDAYPHAPIIALTSVELDPVLREELETVADRAFPKSALRTNLLPILRDLLDNHHEEANPNQEEALSLPRIMIMEDDAHLRNVFTRALRAADYEVHQAATVQEAQVLLSEFQFAVLICDIHVGDSRGTDLLREHGNMLLNSGGQIIMVSGYPRYRAVCEEMGADFFLEKPVSVKTLVRLVQRLTERSGR